MCIGLNPNVIPTKAEIRMIIIGCTFLKDNTLIDKNKNSDIKLKPFSTNTVLPIDSTDAPIKPITAGFKPVIQPFTILFVLNFSKNFATKMIIISEGKITPSVAQIEPVIPAISFPDICCNIYCEWTRSTFTNCNEIYQFVCCKPIAHSNFFLYQRKHRISTAKGKGSNFKECQK